MVSGASGADAWRPVTRVTTYELVLDQIQGQIRSGHLRAGDRLPPERELAAALGVSRVAVREAIGVLKALGVARTAPGSGAEAGTFLHAAPADAMGRLLEMHLMLASISTADLIRARIALERESARLAAENAREADWQAIEAILAGLRDPAASVQTFNELDDAFHVAVAQASGSPLVAELTTALRHAMRLTLLARLNAADDFRGTQAQLCHEHEAIYAALRARDGAAAADLVVEHIARFYAPAGG